MSKTFWDIDPVSGDYLMQGGSPSLTDSLTNPAYFRLKIKRTQWLYAPDDVLGSDLYTLKKRKTTEDASAIEDVAAKALQPLVDDGRAASVTVTTTAVARHGVALQTDIVNSIGEEQSLNLVGI